MSARPRIALLSGWRAALRRRLRAWVRRRHGIDPDPFTLPGRRIYILPTRLGVAFGVMVFAMFLGAMNYANNLALALAFVLGALGLVAMQHSHRNLAGVRLRAAPCEPVFAGQMATFRIAVENPSCSASGRAPPKPIGLASAPSPGRAGSSAASRAWMSTAMAALPSTAPIWRVVL